MSLQKLKGDQRAAKRVRFTAGADTDAGAVVTVGDRVGVVLHDTANGAEGIAFVATDEKGIQMPKTTGAINNQVKVYWDADGNPVGGVAGSGAVTTTASGNKFIGYAAEAAASGDAEVTVEMVDTQG